MTSTLTHRQHTPSCDCLPLGSPPCEARLRDLAPLRRQQSPSRVAELHDPSSPRRPVYRLAQTSFVAAVGALSLMAVTLPAQAQGQALPRTNLLVEVRVVRAADVDPGAAAAPAARATTLSTRDLTDDLPPPQQVRVANGQRGLLRYSRKLPVLWMDSVSAGGGHNGAGAGASYQLVWLEAGQSLAVLASWPGGRAPARVELSLGSAALDSTPGKAIPARQTRSVSTTLVTPLARWTTFAALGQATESRAGQKTLSTRDIAARSARQVFQVRVSAD